MEIENKEKLRASNIIWNASSDYSFQPEFKAFDEKGKADLYWNYIIGAAHKYYNHSLLQDFFNYLKQDKEYYDVYENLMWIGLENCVYEKGKAERPVLESLRRDYAKKVLSKKYAFSEGDIYNRLKAAHFQRVMGEEPEVKGTELNILHELEFDAAMSTEQIINRMDNIVKVYFKFRPTQKKENLLQRIVKNREIIHFGERRKEKNGSSGKAVVKRIDIGAAEYTGRINYEEKEVKNKKLKFHWLKYKEQKDDNEREYIKNYFGIPILPEAQTKALEHILCNENHKNCHLHFTRGEFDKNEDTTYQQKLAMAQRQKNRQYYTEHLVRNKNIISMLTNRIRNSMLLNYESSPSRSKYGKLAAGKVWRNIYLNDSKVFNKNYPDEIGNLSVDIMLDASASQIYRQETVATQGYIIAESLTRCQIPVRVYSFCNMRDYTVINLFRDYGEVKNNRNIFNYYAAGFNRDGMAIRTALHMMKDSPCENKILIILSDGKPNDLQRISNNSINPAGRDYANTVGINDTAQEVRRGIKKGISIICVFTGLDEDVPAAQKIYGRNFVRIKSPERFADIVGVLIQNVLKNLS